MLQMLVGSKWVIAAVVVLAVGLISFFMIQYIQSAERDKILLEQLQDQKEKRDVIKNAIRDRPSDPNDATDSLQYLNSRD